jgi:thiol-disulfide isomerase/thioredoxin
MKRIVFLIISLAFVSFGFANGDGYRISGRVEGFDSGMAYVVGYKKGGGRDTLATGEVVAGKFFLSGHVADRVVEAAVAFEGIQGGYFILLENGTDYTADIDLARRRNSRIVGNHEQRIWNIVLSLDEESKIVTARMQDEVAVARENNNNAVRDSINRAHQRHLGEWAGWRTELARGNPDTYCAAKIISLQTSGKSLAALREEYAFLGEYARNTVPGLEIAALIAKLEPGEIGQIVPDFAFTDQSGNGFSLHGIGGKLIMLDFWASWCAPCRKENPNIIAIYNDYHSKGLEIIGITSDEDADAWRKAIKDDGLPWHHAMNPAIRDYFNISGIPHIILLDSDYRIIARNLKGEVLRTKVAEMLK